MKRHAQLFLTIALFLIVAGVAPTPVVAHEFWIEPSAFTLQPGDVAALSLRVGERFDGEPIAYGRQRVERFVALGPDGMRPVVGREGVDPAGAVRLSESGTHVIAYHGKPSFVELSARKFETYLLEEGLERIIAQRRQLGERREIGRERYSRCAKSLLVVADRGMHRPDRPAGMRGHDAVVGLPLEVIPQTHPAEICVGGTMVVDLLFGGAPLAGALVCAVSAADPSVTLQVRSDDRGRARFVLSRGGSWLIDAVHMVRVDEPSATVDWESFWASLTFEVGEASTGDST